MVKGVVGFDTFVRDAKNQANDGLAPVKCAQVLRVVGEQHKALCVLQEGVCLAA
jgi:hypothetical protein